MQIKKVSIQAIKKDWMRFEEENPKLHYMQRFRFEKLVKSRYLFFTLRKHEFPVFYAFYSAGRCVAIAPMCYRNRNGEKYLSTFGATADLAFQDFIYGKDFNFELAQESVKLLLSLYGKVMFYRLPEDSLINIVCKEMSANESIEKKENINVSIIFEEGYDTHFKALKKSPRQNIRTAYNRMATDEIKYAFELLPGNKVSNDDLKQIMDLYIERRKNHYGFRASGLEWYIRYYHYNNTGFRKLPEGMYAILKMNGKVAAFWGGYRDLNYNSVIVPRLAICEEFSRYSPGMILCCESIKKLKDEYGITCLDLSKGDEKYKFDMGGEVYLTYDYTLLERRK